MYIRTVVYSCISIILLYYLWKLGESSWNTMEIVLAVLFGCRLSPSTAEIGNEGFKWSTDLCAYGWEDIALTLFPTASFLMTPHDPSGSITEEEVKKNLALELRIVEDIPEDEGSTGMRYHSVVIVLI